MNPTMHIRMATLADASAILDIYAYYITTSPITFEYHVPELDDFQSRMSRIMETYPFLVCEVEDQVVAYAYASKHMERAAYQWNVELSIYVKENAQKSGIGKQLYRTLFDLLRLQGVKNVYSCITHPNPKSEHFHEYFGFHRVGIFHKTGYKFNQWYDVVWYEKELFGAYAPSETLLPIVLLDTKSVQDILTKYTRV